MYSYNIKKSLSIGLLLCCIPMASMAKPIDDYDTKDILNKPLSGVVYDEAGEPVSGALVTVDGTTVKGVTDIDGRFNIKAPKGYSDITISHIGCKSLRVNDATESDKPYVLQLDGHDQSVELTLAQGITTTMTALTGAVDVVTNEQIMRTPSNGTTPRLAGQAAGLAFISGTGELNGDGATLFIRGRRSINGNDPLIVLNGVPSPTTDLNILDPNTIENIVVLKDASSMALYGMQGANGALLINTKQGNVGRTKINISAEYAIQTATVLPTVMNSWQYATMRNQALINDNRTPIYSQEDIENYRLGNNPLYPNNRWYDMYTRDHASTQRYNINVSGGNNRVLYFINTSYMHQGSLLKTEEQDKYNPHFYLNRFNVTSNLEVNVFKNFKAGLNTNVIIDNQKGPNSGDYWATMLATPALEHGPVTGEQLDENGEVVVPAGGVVAQDYNMNPIYGRLNKSGSQETTRTTINVALNLDWGLDFITKGLSATALLGYEARYAETTYGSKDYQRYVLDDEQSELLGYPVFTEYGQNVDSPLSMSKGSDLLYYINFLGSLRYNRIFGGRNQIGAMVSYFYQDWQKQNFDPQGMLPFTRNNIAFHAKYGYDNRYFIQFDAAISSSDQFCKAPRKSRYGFFPSVSGSWVLSNEHFWGNQAISEWFTLAKFRASYGIVGNDNVGGGKRFLYMDQYGVGGGGYLGQSPYNGALASEGQLGNPALTWERDHKQDYGIDLGFFNCLTLHFDYFHEKTTDMVVTSQLFPAFSGTDSGNLPYINFGSMKNEGFDFSVEFGKQLSRTLYLSVGARGGYAKNTVIECGEIDRSTAGYAYGYNQTGFSVGQNRGYIIDYSNGNGFYNSKEEIANGPKFESGTPRIGDFIYKDLNDDGIINDKDIAPIGGTDIPKFNYGIDAQIKWRDFDLYALFQGATGRSVLTLGYGANEALNRGVYGDIHLDAYTPERYESGQYISYPALTTDLNCTSLRANSFFITNRNYCRLKTLEVGYNLPSKICKKATMSNVRLFFQAMNLFTIDNRKFKDIDVEASGTSSYPYYRTFNFGLKVSF